MDSTLITANPQFIDLGGERLEFNLDDEKFNRSILRDLKFREKKVGEYRGNAIYRSKNKFYCVQDGLMVYYMSAVPGRVKRMNIDYVTQVKVWRSLTAEGIDGMSSHVFWEILFPEFGTVMSDSQQTDDGKTFWRRQLGRAIKNKFFAYIVNVSSGSIEKITTDTEKAFGPMVYGKDGIFKRWRLIISDVELESIDLVDETVKVLDSLDGDQ